MPKLGAVWLLVAALALGTGAGAEPIGDNLAQAAEALARGDGIAAEVAARRSLDAGASRGEVAALLGEAELLQGNFAEARQWLEAGVFSANTRVRGFYALGLLETREGDLAAAGAAFDRALEFGPSPARLWVDIGRLRYLAGQHHLVADAVRRALTIDPADPRALEFEAQLVRDARGARAALPLLEAALQRVPDDLGLLGEYAATLAEAGRHREMLEIARRMVEVDPRHPRAYYLQAVLAARAGLDGLARRLLARTEGVYDDTAAGRLLAGVLDLRTGNPRLAVERFDALTRHQPDNAAAPLLLSRALLANGEANEVLARLEPATAQPDADPYTLGLLGRAYEQLGRRQEAAVYLDRASDPSREHLNVGRLEQVNPGTGDVAMIRQMLRQGMEAEAARLAAALRVRFPDSVDVEVLSGDVALLRSNAAAALAYYTRAASVRRDAALIQRMAAAHRMLGRDEAAIAVVADYLRENPRSISAASLLGHMLADRGDHQHAQRLLAYAAQLGGGDPPEGHDPRPAAQALRRVALAARTAEPAAAP